MSNYNTDLTILLHMQGYVKEIEDLDLKKMGMDKFANDYVIFNSVSMSLLQIGELAKKLSKEYVKKTKMIIPWKVIKGMRDMFAHNYGNMNKSTIYKTATEDIEELSDFLKKQINEMKNKY